MPPDENAPEGERPWRRRTAAGVIANVVVAAGLTFALSSQPAAGELAVRRIGVDTVSLSLGDGWHTPERLGAQRWTWSRGDAEMTLYSDATQATGPVTLRFGLRGFGSRTVTVRLGERVLWTGALGERAVVVTIPNLNLPPGATVLRLVSDLPPQPESAAPGARAIAFAVYDPELR